MIIHGLVICGIFGIWRMGIEVADIVIRVWKMYH